MAHRGFCAAVLFLACGCASFSSNARTDAHAAPAHPVAVASHASAAAPVAVNDAPATPDTLDAAPWSAEPVARTAAPRSLMQTWRRADNHAWCAPLAPVSDRSKRGAHARAGKLDGGWSLEF